PAALASKFVSSFNISPTFSYRPAAFRWGTRPMTTSPWLLTAFSYATQQYSAISSNDPTPPEEPAAVRRAFTSDRTRSGLFPAQSHEIPRFFRSARIESLVYRMAGILPHSRRRKAPFLRQGAGPDGWVQSDRIS